MTLAQQLRLRLLGYQPPDRMLGWLLPIVVAVLGGFLRFWKLGHPSTLVFDETYYVKQAYSMLTWGYERRVRADLTGESVTPHADQVFASGTPDVFGTDTDFVVHPPVGKWVLAVGQQLFGADNPFGWRFSVAVLGTLSILMVARVARRMFGSTLLGTTAGLLLALEGHHFVHSRTGLLDLMVMFFALGAFCALVIDRDSSRALLADRVGALGDRARCAGDRTWPATDPRMRYGPRLGARPWRWVAAVSLGLCIGTKWSGIYFLAVFGLMTVLWEIGARRTVGVRRPIAGTLLLDAPQAALTIVPTAIAVYVASWVGWFRSDTGWNRDWGAKHPAEGLAGLVPDPVRGLWRYHQEMMDFHVGLTSPHTYQSNPWSWLLMSRPTSFYYEGPTSGVDGCTVEKCSKAITNIGTVSIWWACIAAVFVLLAAWILRRDWRAGAILAGFVAGYLPWFLYQSRTIYTFYAVAFVPWVVLAVTYVLGLVIGPATATAQRRRRGLVIAGAYVVLTAAMFAFWYPIWTAEVIPYSQWTWRMWFPSWI
ncbi:MAG: phospholipid carrier-dependent glycosyltransferase [Austwickia sp.]|nr:phospholipid carrier-dependent glycosyltransferase [Austwickia sp.]